VTARVLVLTPVRNAAEHLEGHFASVAGLDYPADHFAFCLLESDSQDDTWPKLQSLAAGYRNRFTRLETYKHDFGHSCTARHDCCEHRRRYLAQSRNRLLMTALRDDDYVLWLDVDMAALPASLVHDLLAVGKDIVHPNAVVRYFGLFVSNYDMNAWRDKAKLHMDDLKAEGDVVPLHAVGGTVLLIRADLHRSGLIFPPFHYKGSHHQHHREGGEIETEGLGIMAMDMGHQPYGLPNYLVEHKLIDPG
jgi:GT2 family glycosyltransferase